MAQSIQNRLRETYAQMSTELASLSPLIFVSNSVLLTITVLLLFMSTVGTFTIRVALLLPIIIMLLWLITIVFEIQDQRVTITSLREWVQIIGTIVTVGMLVGVGFMLLVFPGIYLLVRTAYAIPIALREDNTPIENIRQSISRTDGMLAEISFVTGYTGVVVVLCSTAIWMIWSVSYLAPHAAIVAAVTFGIGGGLGSAVYQRTVIELAREV